MKLRYKILLSFLILLFAAFSVLAYSIGRTEECGSPPVASTEKPLMRAAMSRCYGSPDVVTLEQIVKPTPAPNEVLVKIKAAAVNPLDWHEMRGSPFVMRLGEGLGKPDDPDLGVDFAGIIEAVGDQVTNFEVGDEVFGGWGGAFAEYLTMPSDRAIVKKPSNITFAEAAAIPIAALTALQGLVDEGNLQAGQRVLINGASGGVGTYAVQIAKSMGAHVSGVCSTRNVALVRSLGADQVFDYKKEDYTKSGQTFDLILDLVGNHPLSANRSVLEEKGTMVIIGGPKGDWFGPFKTPLLAAITNSFVDQKLGMFIARMRQKDLVTLAGMMQEGTLTSRIDRFYELENVAEALRYSESGRARGKIIVTMN